MVETISLYFLKFISGLIISQRWICLRTLLTQRGDFISFIDSLFNYIKWKII